MEDLARAREESGEDSAVQNTLKDNPARRKSEMQRILFIILTVAPSLILFIIFVIVPVFNAEAYLEACLNSALAQSLREIEILCVDDGSTDSSPEILRRLAEKDTRVRVFRQGNARQGAARNLALAHARGKYVAFLDADDELAPGAADRLFSCAEAGRLDMLLLSCVRVDASGRERRWSYHDFSKFLPRAFPRTLFSRRDCPPKLFWRMPCSCWGTFYSREFLEKNALRFPEKIFFEDRPFFFEALAAADRVGVLDEPLYRYRENPNSTVASKGEHLADNIEQGMETLRRVREHGVPADVLSEGVVAHAHDLLKSLGLCPRETLAVCRKQLCASFEEMFPPRERAALLARLPNAQDRACARVIFGNASAADRAFIRLCGLKYAALRHFARGERRERYFEKSGLSKKILSLSFPLPQR